MTDKEKHKAQKVWGGRFREDIHELVDEFNSSISFDRRLYAQEIEGSMAHCRMLAKQEIISDEDATQMIRALAEIKSGMDRNEYTFIGGKIPGRKGRRARGKATHGAKPQ
jgi:argininosuccinate lyase